MTQFYWIVKNFKLIPINSRKFPKFQGQLPIWNISKIKFPWQVSRKFTKMFHPFATIIRADESGRQKESVRTPAIQVMDCFSCSILQVISLGSDHHSFSTKWQGFWTLRQWPPKSVPASHFTTTLQHTHSDFYSFIFVGYNEIDYLECSDCIICSLNCRTWHYVTRLVSLW